MKKRNETLLKKIPATLINFSQDIETMQEDEKFDIRSSRIDSFKGFIKTFFWLSKEEWTDLDHKLLRIVFGVVGFGAMALFWLFFLRNIVPF